ncbi:MAG: PAS domain S-box protein [Symbiopectobacterium sp.]
MAKALREIKTLNDLIIESAADGVIAVDKYNNVTTINPAAQEIIGYQQDELLG